MMGVYEITNLLDGEMASYIGSSHDIKNRWRQHIWRLRSGKHGNRHLQRAWDKWGEGAFSFCVLEQVDGVNELLSREQYYLDRLFESGDNPYNIASDASASARGRVVSKEARLKMSIAKKGTTRSPEALRKQSETLRGRKRSEKTKRKIGDAHAKPYPSFVHKESGRVIPAGTNMAQLCREMGLHGTKMGLVKSGKVKHYKGWVLLEALHGKQGPVLQESNFSEEHRLKISNALAGSYPAFIHRETNEIIPAGSNMARLCRAMGLHDGHMHSVKNGERKSHKGWMLLEGSEEE